MPLGINYQIGYWHSFGLLLIFGYLTRDFSNIADKIKEAPLEQAIEYTLHIGGFWIIGLLFSLGVS